MHFELVTVVPEAVEGYLAASILGRAATSGAVSFGVTGLRDYGEGKHRVVDDAPYGGGPGMVMKPGPLVEAIEHARSSAPDDRRVRVLMTDPTGQVFDREMAHRLAQEVDHLVVICGRYEGVDARVEPYVDELVSVGDVVLTGGELAALVVVDAVARLRPGVLGNDASSQNESFEDQVLEHPQYTRPSAFRGVEVPEVLLSGDHGRVAKWRREMSLQRTLERRPDLLGPRSQWSSELQEWSRKVDAEKK